MKRFNKVVAMFLVFAILFTSQAVTNYASAVSEEVTVDVTEEGTVSGEEGSIGETKDEMTVDGVDDAEVTGDELGLEGKGTAEEAEGELAVEGEESAVEPEDKTEVGREEFTEEPEVLDFAIQYVYLESNELVAPGIQNILISADTDITSMEEVYLTLQKDGQAISTIPISKAIENLLLFTKEFANESGTYKVLNFTYKLNGVSYTCEIEEDITFVVENENTSGIGVFRAPEITDEEIEDSVISTEAGITSEDVQSAITNSEQMIKETEASEKDLDISSTTRINGVSISKNARMLRTSTSGNNIVIVLDPGHGGSDSGAVYGSLLEKNLNLAIARYAKAELEKYPGVTVHLTRNSDTYVGLYDRANYAKSVGASALVSIHINSTTGGATSANGAEVFVTAYSKYNASSTQLASLILKELAKVGLSTSRGVKINNDDHNNGHYDDGTWKDDLAVIRQSILNGIPAILVEHGFINNAGDYSLLASEAKLKEMGVADATAIAEHYGLKQSIFKWTNLTKNEYKIGENAELYYAVNQNATIDIELYDGSNSYIKTLVSKKAVGTNDQVIRWDLKGRTGEDVSTGQYRITIKATDSAGKQTVVHKYFNVKGQDPVSFKWVNLSAVQYQIGSNAQLYYAVNRSADITVQVYDGKNEYIKTLLSNKRVATNDQVINWDLKGRTGEYVSSGQYRFTITAKDTSGNQVVSHKYFNVKGQDPVFFKWTNLSAIQYQIGSNAQLYYAVSRSADITVQVYDGKNEYIKTLLSNKRVATNDQVINWDLKGRTGEYVSSGQYRFTITAKDTSGNQVVSHKYFNVKGQDPVFFKWTNLSAIQYQIGSNAQLYYAVNRSADITVQVYDGKNEYIKTLISNKRVATNDQAINWDLKGRTGEYVSSGQYRFTITAKDTSGNQAVSHKYFIVQSGYNIMGTSNAVKGQLVSYYKSKNIYPIFYLNTDAPTIEAFCQIYVEECLVEGVRVEVAFAQAMKETGFLTYGGDVFINQFNFAGLDASGKAADGTINRGKSYSSVREGIRAHVQRLKAYAAKGTTGSSYSYPCIDSEKFASSWWINTIVGCSPYVEWLGKEQNPNGYGWATAPNYGNSLKKDYLEKLLSF